MKSLTRVHFSTAVPQDGVPIAVVTSSALRPDEAMSIEDRSARIGDNAFFERGRYFVLDETYGLTADLSKASFDLTDRILDNGRPLYYRHDLRYPIRTEDDGSSSLTVTDADGLRVSTDRYRYDCKTRTVYHDLDADLGVFRVQYARADTTNALVDEDHVELLGTAPAFRRAEPEDLDAAGCLDPDLDGYLLEEQAVCHAPWRLTVPRPGTYAVRYRDEGLLRLRPPQGTHQAPWYVEVNETVLRTINRSTEVALRYAIPEFWNQDFRPYPPIRIEADEPSLLEPDRIVRLRFGRIVLTTKTPIDIKVLSADGTMTQAITTDQHKIGQSLRGIPWQVITIDSIDLEAGRIDLRGQVSRGSQILTSYYRETRTHRYTGYNFNPLYNPNATTETVGILCRPTSTPAVGASLSHVVLDANGSLTSASDAEIAAWIAAGSRTLDDLTTDWLFDPTAATTNAHNYFLLGLVHTGLPYSSHRAVIRDARRRGGGLADRFVDTALAIAPETCHRWDLRTFDGPREPIQGALVVYLPVYLRQFHSDEDLRARIQKFMPAGAYALLRFY